MGQIVLGPEVCSAASADYSSVATEQGFSFSENVIRTPILLENARFDMSSSATQQLECNTHTIPLCAQCIRGPPLLELPFRQHILCVSLGIDMVVDKSLRQYSVEGKHTIGVPPVYQQIVHLDLLRDSLLRRRCTVLERTLSPSSRHT